MIHTSQIQLLLGHTHLKKTPDQELHEKLKRNPNLKQKLIIDCIEKHGAMNVQSLADKLPITLTSVDVQVRKMLEKKTLKVIKKRCNKTNKARLLDIVYPKKSV